MFFTNCYPKSMYDTAAVCTTTLNFEYLMYGLIFIVIVIAAAIAVTVFMQYRRHKRMDHVYIAEEYLPDGLYGRGPTGDSWEPDNPFLEVDDRADGKYL
jgi:hypothetical protein